MGKNTNANQDELLLTGSKKSSSKKKANKNKREFPVFTVFCVVVGILLAALITSSVLDNNGFFTRQKIVLQVADTSVNAVEFSYFYNQTKNYYTSLYSQYGILDTNTDIKTTQCSLDTTKTWAAYFVDVTVSQLKQTLYLYNEAKANNVTLTDEQLKTKETMYESIDSICDENNLNRSTYFSAVYGNGFNEGDFERLADLSIIAEAQQALVTDAYTYSDEDLQKYYEENKTDFDLYTYRTQPFTYTTYTEDTTKSAEENETAKAAAEASKTEAEAKAKDFLAKITDEESFKTEAAAVSDTAETTTDSTLVTDSAYSDNEIGKWLSDSARVTGDKDVIENSGSNQYVVLYYISAARPEYKLANIKHIQLSIEDTSSDTTATSEEETAEAEAKKQAAKDTAKQKADEVYQKYSDNGATEEAFNALVADNTNDTSTAQSDGKIENLKKNIYGTAFDEWVFAADRAVGDCTVIELSSSYDVVYYLGADVPCWKYDAESAKKNDDWKAYTESLATKYESSLTQNDSIAIEMYA